MKAMRGFLSPWALGAIALWIVFMAVQANVEYLIATSTGDGPEGSHVAPILTLTDWLVILGTATIVASIAIAALAGLFVLALRRFSWPWLLAGIGLWLAILVFAYDWVLGLELFKTFDPPVNGVVWSYTVQRQPILAVFAASMGASILVGLLAGVVSMARQNRSA